MLALVSADFGAFWRILADFGVKPRFLALILLLVSSDRAFAATVPPPYLLPDPHRARVTRVSSAHHEEVGGPLVSSASSRGSTGP